MKTIRVQSRIAWLVSALVILFQISPARAGGPAHTASNERRGVNVPFTKWITEFPAMAGVAGHNDQGVFAGEVLNAKPTTIASVTSITWLEAVYQIEIGHRSFTALIRGGQNNETGLAVLDGVILNGWRAGARVHVEYQVISSCAGKPAGPCFQGTIRVMPGSAGNE